MAVLLFATEPATAQILIGPGPAPFQEVPVPSDPAPVFVGEGEYYEGADIFIRRGQQGVEFDPGLAVYADFRVRVNDGPWEVLHNGSNRTGPIVWTSPPSAPPPTGALVAYAVTISYSGSTSFQYDFNLFTVPPADRAFTSAEVWEGQSLQHTILVWSGTDGGASLDKPLLVVEGIDAVNENNAASYYALGSDPNAELFPRGQAEGADVAVLNFGDGGRDMRLNAAVARRAVLAMQQYKQSTRSTDVAGVSMGGVVARYALAKMEEDGETHGVGTFASIDAPQRGAVIDRSLQQFIRDRTTATGGGSSVTSAIHTVCIEAPGCSGTTGNGGDEVAGDPDAASKTGSAGDQQTPVRVSAPGEETDEMALELWPNPSAGEVSVRFNAPEDEAVDLAVHDLLGRVVYRERSLPAGTTSLDLSALPSGAYLVRAISGTWGDVQRVTLRR